jgi:putative hemolysin
VDSLLFEILIIVLLSLINGVFSMSELAIVSANPGRLAVLASKGRRGAAIALKLAANSGQFLATVQIGITLIGIVSGVFGGATLGEDLAGALITYGLKPAIAEPVAFVTVVGFITYLSLVVGELVPKQIALSYPETVACLMSLPLLVLSRVGTPLVWILDSSSKLVSKVLPFKVGQRAEVSESDIKNLIAQSATSGEIRRTEKEIALRVFRLDDRPISAFMTARPDMEWLDLNKPLEELWSSALSVPHFFFPVCKGGIDNLLGIISIKDLCIIRASSSSINIKDLVRPAVKILSTRDALSVLEEFKKQRRQVAIVLDEHGDVDGMVTTHDLLEAIVGDLADFEGEELSIVRRENGTVLVDASVDIHELLLFLKIEAPEKAPLKGYQSVGGVVFGELNTLPTVGAKVTWSGLTFEVLDMDGPRMDKVLVTKVSTK